MHNNCSEAIIFLFSGSLQQCSNNMYKKKITQVRKRNEKKRIKDKEMNSATAELLQRHRQYTFWTSSETSKAQHCSHHHPEQSECAESKDFVIGSAQPQQRMPTSISWLRESVVEKRPTLMQRIEKAKPLAYSINLLQEEKNCFLGFLILSQKGKLSEKCTVLCAYNLAVHQGHRCVVWVARMTASTI